MIEVTIEKTADRGELLDCSLGLTELLRQERRLLLCLLLQGRDLLVQRGDRVVQAAEFSRHTAAAAGKSRSHEAAQSAVQPLANGNVSETPGHSGCDLQRQPLRSSFAGYDQDATCAAGGLTIDRARNDAASIARKIDRISSGCRRSSPLDGHIGVARDTRFAEERCYSSVVGLRGALKFAVVETQCAAAGELWPEVGDGLTDKAAYRGGVQRLHFSNEGGIRRVRQ